MRRTAARCSWTRSADLPLPMQVKLLRAIQEKRVRKVGATSEDPVDVRIICATHQIAPRAGRSRQVPPGPVLPARRHRAAPAEPARMPGGHSRCSPTRCSRAWARKAVPGAARLSAAALAALVDYDFPGNVRELENVLERAIALSGTDEIQPDDLQLAPPTIAEEPQTPNAKWPLPGVPRPGGARGDPRSARQDALQPHRRGQAPRHHLPRPALPDGAARDPLAGRGDARRPRRPALAGTGSRPGRDAVVADRRRRDRRRSAAGALAKRRRPPARNQITLLVVHNISLPPGEFGGRRRRAALHEHARSARPTRLTSRCGRCESRRISSCGGLARSSSSCRAGGAPGTPASPTWGGRSRCNDFSIGVELEGTDTVPYADVAVRPARGPRDRALRRRYPIADLAGHSDVAPGRKTDPGPAFDWPRLRALVGAARRRR